MLIARRGGFPGGLDAAGHGCRYRIELESFFLVNWRWELGDEEGLG